MTPELLADATEQLSDSEPNAVGLDHRGRAKVGIKDWQRSCRSYSLIAVFVMSNQSGRREDHDAHA